MFDKEALNVFKEKGDGNSVTVRRVIQLTKDMSKKEMKDLRILDLGCGEGVYALEAGSRGAKVTAIDGRDIRLKLGKEIAERHNFKNVQFIVDDVRNVTQEKYGNFDVVYLLGLLYHLDEPELFQILENLYTICQDVLIIDTNIALSTPLTVQYDGNKYHGVKYVEHEPGDDEDLINQKRVMHSIGNYNSFLPSKTSLIKFLNKIGFTTVMECYAPLEPNKIEGRITLVAIKSQKEKLVTYPWLNSLTEEEIYEKYNNVRTQVPFVLTHKLTFKQRVKLYLDKFLETRGFELKRKLND